MNLKNEIADGRTEEVWKCHGCKKLTVSQGKRVTFCKSCHQVPTLLIVYNPKENKTFIHKEAGPISMKDDVIILGKSKEDEKDEEKGSEGG